MLWVKCRCGSADMPPMSVCLLPTFSHSTFAVLLKAVRTSSVCCPELFNDSHIRLENARKSGCSLLSLATLILTNCDLHVVLHGIMVLHKHLRLIVRNCNITEVWTAGRCVVYAHKVVVSWITLYTLYITH